MPRLKTECHLKQEFAFLILLGIEEESEIVEDVVEQEVHDDTSSDRFGQNFDEFIVFLDLTESVVGPVVLEMLVDLFVQRVWQRLVLSETSQQSHPIVKVKCLPFIAQILIECRDDVNERVHNEGEECYTEQLDHHHNDFLTIGNWIQISIADSRKGCDREIGSRNDLVRILLFV